jgi:hypothetical protein
VPEPRFLIPNGEYDRPFAKTVMSVGETIIVSNSKLSESILIVPFGGSTAVDAYESII